MVTMRTELVLLQFINALPLLTMCYFEGLGSAISQNPYSGSSASPLNLVFSHLVRLLSNISNRTGPVTNPCSTPLVISPQTEYDPWNHYPLGPGIISDFNHLVIHQYRAWHPSWNAENPAKIQGHPELLPRLLTLHRRKPGCWARLSSVNLCWLYKLHLVLYIPMNSKACLMIFLGSKMRLSSL